MKQGTAILSTSVLFTLLCASTLAQPLPSTDYDLAPASQYTEGCLEPCMCPIWMAEDLRGRFGLHLSRIDGSFHVYNVLDVVWEYAFGGETIPVHGWGTYRVDPVERVHQLELDLEIGEEAVEHFDSGLVPWFEPAPKLSIAVAMNEFFCYDKVFEIVAVPTIPTVHHTDWAINSFTVTG